MYFSLFVLYIAIFYCVILINANIFILYQGLKTAIIEGDVIGGTCVNRGCVPSKALLAVSGRMRELQDEQHLKALGLRVNIFSREKDKLVWQDFLYKFILFLEI